MWIDSVVINASPLIALFRSQQSELLPRLFSRIVVPEAVWQEVVRDHAGLCPSDDLIRIIKNEAGE